MAEWLDRAHAGIKMSRDAAAEVDRLSQAFYVTGNTKMADALANLCDRIFEAQELMNDAVGLKISQDDGQSKRMLGETVLMAMSVLTQPSCAALADVPPAPASSGGE